MENINGIKAKIFKEKETKDIEIAKDKIQKKTQEVKMKKNDQIREREEQEKKNPSKKTQKQKKYFFLFSAFEIGLLFITLFPSLEPFKCRPPHLPALPLFIMLSSLLFSSVRYIKKIIKEYIIY